MIEQAIGPAHRTIIEGIARLLTASMRDAACKGRSGSMTLSLGGDMAITLELDQLVLRYTDLRVVEPRRLAASLAENLLFAPRV